MRECLRRLWHHRALIYCISIPFLLLPIALVDPQPKWQCAYVLVLMACFWVPQVIPIAVTSLLPLILFPMLGIIPSRDTAKIYMSDAALVFFGGMVLATAIQVWDIHKRIALGIIRLVGSNPRWLLLGLMLSTWVLSMWISNTATTAMMIPIAQAILSQLSHHEDDEETLQDDPEMPQLDSSRNRRSDNRVYQRMAKGLTLSIANAANIGGMATLTGTPSNMVLKGQIDMLYAKYNGDSPVTFSLWLAMAFPLSFILLVLAWGWLQIFFLPWTCREGGCSRHGNTQGSENVKSAIRAEYKSLGSVTFAQSSVLTLFILLVLLWVSRDLGGAGGWGLLFPARFVSDATPAIAVSILLFILPSKNPFKLMDSDASQSSLLSWKQLNSRMPWGILLLLGGGLSLAKGCEASGLSDWVGGRLESVSHLNPTLLLFIVCCVVSVSTEVTTNVAITTLILPVLSQLALATKVNPLYYMFPATLSASFSFMLPVATPANAIVFSSGNVKVTDMVLSGLVLNIIAVPLVVLATETWGKSIFDLNVFPDPFKNMTMLTNASVSA